MGHLDALAQCVCRELNFSSGVPARSRQSIFGEFRLFIASTRRAEVPAHHAHVAYCIRYAVRNRIGVRDSDRLIKPHALRVCAWRQHKQSGNGVSVERRAPRRNEHHWCAA